MKLILFSSLLSLTSILSGQSNDRQNYDHEFDPLLDEIAKELVGVGVSIKSTKWDMNYTGAAGFDGRKRETKVDKEQPFRIASITKTIVATTILRLEEMGRLSIEESIVKYVSNEHLSMLRKDGYQVEEITIRSCLNHTSGLLDYAMAKTDYVKIASKTPNRRWTRTEQIALAMKIGKPVNDVGKEYHYSDTGYVLLGEIIEKTTGKSLAVGIRSVLNCEALGMRSTWLESLEDHPREKDRKVRRYLGKQDATEWDPSVDLYGGGGYVSTTNDLATFMDALFADRIFENPETLKKMLTKVDLKKSGEQDYRLGIFYQDFGTIDAYMHSGLWGTYLFYFPSLDVTVCVNQTVESEPLKIGPIIGKIKEIIERKRKI